MTRPTLTSDPGGGDPPPDGPQPDAGAPHSDPPRIERISFSADGEISDPELFARCRALRQQVFVEEQSVPPALEWDGLDEEAEHFAACLDARDGPNHTTVIGTARLRWLDASDGPAAETSEASEASSVALVALVGKAERVAVLASARSRGVGRSLMEAIERCAVERGGRSLVLNAQVAVVPFYERLGYESHSEVFLSAGIEHLAMTKRIG